MTISETLKNKLEKEKNFTWLTDLLDYEKA